MANLRTELESYETRYGEPIEAIVVGKHYNAGWDEATKPDENIVLSREAGLAKVDQEYDDGFGGADCYPLYAWTRSRVFLVHEYDGATDMRWVPRNPARGEPVFGGASEP